VSTPSKDTVVVINPAAGRVRRDLEGWTQRLSRYTLRFTEAAGQGRQVAADAVAQGARTVISLGGDGTHNEVLNGLLDSGAPDLTLGVLHGGTGGDFRRSLTHQGAVEGLDAPASVIDVIQVQVGGEIRHALNLASVGVAAAIDQRVNASSKRLGGTASFYVATLRALASFQAPRLQATLDGAPMGEHATSLLCAANAPYAGGGMMFAPKAKLNDGLLDAVWIKDAGVIRSALDLPKLYGGTHLDLDRCVWGQGQVLEVVALGDTPGEVEMDGEPWGDAPVRFSVVPGAIKLLDANPAFLA
jgi:YegS/Rv2252/BmrU family lipid kinase